MPTRTRIREIVRFLDLNEDLLDALRREGLFEEEWLEPASAEELRVAAALMQDLGVNPAGVQVILHMRRRMQALEERMGTSLRRLLSELEGR